MGVIKEKMVEKEEDKVDIIEEKKEDFAKLLNTGNVTEKIKVDEKKSKRDKKNKENYVVCKEDNKKRNYIIYLIIAFFSLIIIFLSILVYYNIVYQKIFSNMYIGNVEVSNLTKEEAIKKLEEAMLPNLERDIILSHEDYEHKITPFEIDASYNIEETVNNIYNIGRTGNIYNNNVNMLKSFFKKTIQELELSYNEEKLTQIVDQINSEFAGLIQSSYEVLEDKVVIKKGAPGTEVKKDKLKEQIINNINNSEGNNITFGVIVRSPDAIDIDEIYSKVYKAPVDAYYTSDPFEIHKSEEGVDFAITIDEAKALLETEQEEYVINLKTVAPVITTDQIGTEAFPDLLATCTSPYIASKVGRTTNLKIASGKIDGSVIMPGETFSYNKTVGKRTVEAGFQMAGVYSGGQVVDGLGGGICQISSTLYNIAVMSNLEIVERENHTFLPGYLPAGRDATVVYGALDFKFKNNRDYPVKIQSVVQGGYVSMKMFGKKVENEPAITFETVYHQTLYPQTIYKDTTNLAEGVTKVESSGQNGCKSTTYKVEKLNGQVVSKTVLSSDTYKAMNKVVLRGVKKQETQPVVEETVVE